MNDRALALARELERADAEVAAAIGEVAELQREADGLREQAEAVETALAALPARRDAAAAAAARAREELEARRVEAARAEQELAAASRSRDEERLRRARRAAERAGSVVDDAERRLARVEEEAASVEREADEARAQVPDLEASARSLADRVRALPRISAGAGERPGSGLAGVIGWSARAQAALWVVRSGLEGERERVVREANELSASVLGEAVTATSVTLVRRRLEQSG